MTYATITTAQEVDFLYKKLGYGVAKTDNSARAASSESYASPFLTLGSAVYQQDYLIPQYTSTGSFITGGNTVYNGQTITNIWTVQCTNIPGSVANATWITGKTDWIPVALGGQGYQVSVFAGPAGINISSLQGNGASATGPAGTVAVPINGVNSDSWFFDYQAGILNFVDVNVPSSIAGNVIYVVGATYTGQKGIATWANLNVNGNITSINGNIVLTNGLVSVGGVNLISNIVGLSNSITGANSSIQNLSANIGSYYVWANANTAGLYNSITGANASIQNISANIGAFETFSNANVAGLYNSITGANATIQTLSANVGAFETFSNANTAGLYNSILGANSSIQTISANIGSYYIWANANVGGIYNTVTTHSTWLGNLQANVYSNVNMLANLAVANGNVTIGTAWIAGNLTAIGNVIMPAAGTANGTTLNYDSQSIYLNTSMLNNLTGQPFNSGFQLQAKSLSGNNSQLLFQNNTTSGQQNNKTYYTLNSQNSIFQVNNSNDGSGIQLMETYGTGYFGISTSLQSFTNYFGISYTSGPTGGAGAIGSITPLSGVGPPTWRNLLDDGFGNLVVGFATPNSVSFANIAYSTPATSTTSGALRVAGGAGIAGNLYLGGGTLTVQNTVGNVLFTVANTVSNPTDYWNITGGAGNGPVLSVVSTNTYGTGTINAKGSAGIILKSDNSTTALLSVLGSPTTTTNYSTIAAGGAGNVVVHGVAGTDTNIGLLLQTKGTGNLDVAAGTVTLSNGNTITGYDLNAGGFYLSTPTIAFAAPTTSGGSTATANASMRISGTVVAGNVGSGYNIGDTLTVSGGTPAAGYSAQTFTVTGNSATTYGAGGISSVTYTTQYYYVMPTASISSGGGGTNNYLAVTGGSGTGANIAMFTGFVVGGVNINTAGSGYVEPPTITITGGSPVTAATAYSLVGSTPTIRTAGGALNFSTPSGTQFQLGDTYGASPTAQYISVAGRGAGGNGPVMSVQGTDPSISFNITSKGTGAINFETGNGAYQQFSITNTTGSVNYLAVTGSTTGNPLSLSAQGTDANISLQLQSKGSGNVFIPGTSTHNGVATFNSAILVNPSSGTQINLNSASSGTYGTIGNPYSQAWSLGYGASIQALLWFSNGNVLLPATTTSNNTTTGALVVAGGVGVAGNINVGGNLSANTITVTSTVQSVSNTTGAIVTSGIGVGGNLYVGNRTGYVWGANNASAVYQAFNSTTYSLDTIFG